MPSRFIGTGASGIRGASSCTRQTADPVRNRSVVARQCRKQSATWAPRQAAHFMLTHIIDTFRTNQTVAAHPSRPQSGTTAGILKLVWQNAMIAGTYWALAVLVKWYFSSYRMWPAPLWLPAGVALFAALAMGRWSWPGIFLGALLADAISFGEPLAWAACFSFGNTIAPLLAAELIRDRMPIGEPFSRVADVIFVGCAAFLDGMIAATIGMTTMFVKISAPVSALPERWFEWALSDAGAALLLVPFFLLWRSQPSFLLQVRKQLGQFLISTSAAILAVVYLLFGTTGIRAADAGASFLILLPLLWMAVRLSLSVAYPVYVLVITATIVGTMSGRGPFFGVERGGTLAIFAQMAIGFGASVLLLGWRRQRTACGRGCTPETQPGPGRPGGPAHRGTARNSATAGKSCLLRPPDRLAQSPVAGRTIRFLPGGRAPQGEPFSILLIDLDHFKDINDNFGHAAGDALLVETGCRLTTSVRECDMVSRIGGDEFVVLLPETSDQADVDALCRRILRRLAEPVPFNEHQLRISPSIGVALFPDHGATWQLLYKAVDLAAYQAKRAGRHTWQWYLPDGSTVDRVLRD